MLTSKNVQSISPFLIFISISIIIIYYSNKSNRKNYVKHIYNILYNHFDIINGYF
jgi:hypothetical protein